MEPRRGRSGLTASDLVRQIRTAQLDPSECYRVRDLSLAEEDLKLYFNEGYLIFSKPVNGERVSAVSSPPTSKAGTVRFCCLPPYRGERQLAGPLHPKSSNLDEHVSAAALVFSDGSAQMLLEAIPRRAPGGRPGAPGRCWRTGGIPRWPNRSGLLSCAWCRIC